MNASWHVASFHLSLALQTLSQGIQYHVLHNLLVLGLWASEFWELHYYGWQTHGGAVCQRHVANLSQKHTKSIQNSKQIKTQKDEHSSSKLIVMSQESQILMVTCNEWKQLCMTAVRYLISSVLISLMSLVAFWNATRRTSKWTSSRWRLSNALSWRIDKSQSNTNMTGRNKTKAVSDCLNGHSPEWQRLWCTSVHCSCLTESVGRDTVSLEKFEVD